MSAHSGVSVFGRKPLRNSLFAAILFLVGSAWPGAPIAFAGDKIDTLLLLNGDRFVGEIKQFDRGVLQFDMDATDKINVKWENIVEIRSPRFFRVELRSGAFLFGSLSSDTAARRLRVGTALYAESAPLDSIIRITQIDRGFWQSIDARISLGLNYTKASDIAQTTLSFKADQKAEKNYRSLDADVTLTLQKDEETSQRHNVSLTTQWYLGERWFALAVPSYQKNTELGLVARYSAGAGVGRYFTQSTTHYFYWNTGVSVNYELGTREDGSTGSEVVTEGVAGGRYALFRFSQPEIDIDAVINYLPTLPNFDRSRVDADLTLSWEIVTDLTWDLSYYLNFDSRPPSGEGASFDYGIVFGLGIDL